MQKNFHSYILLFILGLFLMPSVSFACEMKSEKVCCTKEAPVKSEKKACCKDMPSDHEDKGCEGKCGHSNCTSAASTSSFAVLNDYSFPTNAFDFSTEKQKFQNSKTFVLSGFSSLWLIPKIG